MELVGVVAGETRRGMACKFRDLHLAWLGGRFVGVVLFFRPWCVMNGEIQGISFLMIQIHLLRIIKVAVFLSLCLTQSCFFLLALEI